MSLWSEIKQRRITQIVLTYLMGGWAVLVVVDQVVDREVLPLVVYEVVLTAYLVGILAALVIGWYHGEKGEQKAPPVEIALLSVIALVATGAIGLVIRNATSEATLADAIDEGDLRSIAVLYLDDVSGDGSLQAVADGITEGVISALSTVRDIDVVSRNGSREARSLGDVSPDSIAAVLDVGALVSGTLDQVGDELTVSIELLEGVTGLSLFRDKFQWPAVEVATVGTELAAQVAEALREQLGLEIRVRQDRDEAPNPAAWLQVARAERFIKDAEEAIQSQDAEGAYHALEAAEAELIAAAESAPGWAKPLALRSRIAYERYIFAQSLEEFVGAMAEAVEHAEAALALEPDNAAALEWRGTARYRRWLDGHEGDDTLLEQARADLERARSLDRSRASVSSTLSHLYYQVDDWTQAVLAAREAYEQDAFLDVADQVLWRLVTAYYDLGEHANAEEACERGRERYPRDYRFTQCQLLVMTMPSADADVDAAWALYEELIPLLAERPEYNTALARAMVGGIIGRAGLADSAQAVFETARIGPELDEAREVLVFEAAMRSVMGDLDGSVGALERFVVGNRVHAPGRHWWWRNLEGRPDFERLRSEH